MASTVTIQNVTTEGSTAPFTLTAQYHDATGQPVGEHELMSDLLPSEKCVRTVLANRPLLLTAQAEGMVLIESSLPNNNPIGVYAPGVAEQAGRMVRTSLLDDGEKSTLTVSPERYLVICEELRGKSINVPQPPQIAAEAQPEPATEPPIPVIGHESEPSSAPAEPPPEHEPAPGQPERELEPVAT